MVPVWEKGKRLAVKILVLVFLQSPVVLAVIQNLDLSHWSQEIEYP
jgi:hypothetical protein